MRRRLQMLIAAIVLAVVLGFTGRATDVEAWHVLAGLGWVTAILLAISLLPWWSRVVPPVPAMPGLFTAPGPEQRWCTVCGTPAPAEDPCPICGTPT